MELYTNCWGPLKIYLLVFILGFFYFVFAYIIGYDLEKNDVLNKSDYTCPVLGDNCGTWPILHFLFYVILGFLFPECFILLMIIGLFWEGIEILINVITNYYLNKPLDYKLWMNGSYRDIIYNVIGYLVGASLAVMIRGNINPCTVGCVPFPVI